ncbi:hypothetical protein GE107_12840 [Cohnella sp. CFH 77786]|uniref:hypothetical protein n=1 Tax=Cohnella sp. CFH 77786 TaxID=2662265 RepID=UPI001C609DBA|nr:hypothetical protein [Cohnella sp. CFH 77786]MBW5446948.1 hypothetical protein [Cohnella sp. CFH 77786]
MAVVVCPWCQSEIPQEEGAEPEKWCPVCENELGGYRTLRVGLGDSGDEDEEEEEEAAGSTADREDLSWAEEGGLIDHNEALLRFEETVEKLLDEQDTVPACPQCQEYMLEAGEAAAAPGSFRPRVSKMLGQALLTAPFSFTVYVCPSCFTVQYSLSEQARGEIARRLSQVEVRGGKRATRS